MDYETFDRLHKHDPIMFSMAMEIFLENGRIAIQESGRLDLITLILRKVASLLMEAKMQEIIDTANAFARLDTGDLLNYARRSGYYIGENDTTQKSNGSC